MIVKLIFCCLLLVSNVSYAYEKCPEELTTCDMTVLGKLEYIWGQNTKDKKSRLLLNGKEIFKNDSSQIGWVQEGWFFSDNGEMGSMTKFVIYYNLNKPREINKDLYLYRAYRVLDFSGKNVVISNEFYPREVWNIDLDWVSWGKKNAVIVFEDGSRFRYEKGQVTMIDAGSASQAE